MMHSVGLMQISDITGFYYGIDYFVRNKCERRISEHSVMTSNGYTIYVANNFTKTLAVNIS